MNENKTGAFISSLRKEKELTQKQLADLVGVSDKTISKWEKGIAVPHKSYFPQIAKAAFVEIPKKQILKCCNK